jgi:hypothetical protein
MKTPVRHQDVRILTRAGVGLSGTVRSRMHAQRWPVRQSSSYVQQLLTPPYVSALCFAQQ